MKPSYLPLLLALSLPVMAQDAVASLEGEVRDASGGALSGAAVTIRNLETGYQQAQVTAESGFFKLTLLPVGAYRLTVERPGFARYQQQPVRLNVSQTVRVDVTLALASQQDTVTVEGDASLVDPVTNTLGKVVTSKEVLDLPLNGRNFTQLGLLQAGVAPLTGGIQQSGGSLRSGQGYAVNGQRPESNSLPRRWRQQRQPHGWRLRAAHPSGRHRRVSHPHAHRAAGIRRSQRIDHQCADALGLQCPHGSLYEFLRNDKLDARNFFSQSVEPLKQNQFGGTVGGPIQRDRTFFFGYYEGFRNRQGVTRSAVVATPAQRQGDYSGQVPPLLDLSAGGVPIRAASSPPACSIPCRWV